jgi:hypothetical protein
MRKQRAHGPAVHTIAFPVTIDVTDEVSKRDFIHWIGAVEVIGVVGLFPKSQKGAGATGNPAIPNATNSLGGNLRC